MPLTTRLRAFSLTVPIWLILIAGLGATGALVTYAISGLPGRRVATLLIVPVAYVNLAFLFLREGAKRSASSAHQHSWVTKTIDLERRRWGNVLESMRKGLNNSTEVAPAELDAALSQTMDDERHGAPSLAVMDPAAQEEFSQQRATLARQRLQLASTIRASKSLRDATAQLSRDIDATGDRLTQELRERTSSLSQALDSERSDRILGFARRDSSKKLPTRCVILLTVPRSGSTWLFDALRTHPAISLEPTAALFRRLGLAGGRYPRGLSNGPDGILDFELTAGKGARIPDFPAPVEQLNPGPQIPRYAIEKIHPEFFGFQPDRLLAAVNKLERECGTEFRFVYLARDPEEALLSFWGYKERDPTWYRVVPFDQVPSYMAKSYRALLETTRAREGLVVEYEALKSHFDETMVRLYRFLWGEESQDRMMQWGDRARRLTQRLERTKKSTSPFFTESAPEVRYTARLREHRASIQGCYDSYTQFKRQAARGRAVTLGLGDEV